MNASRLFATPLILFALMLAACEPALAAPVTTAFALSWDLPTTRADGGALPVGELAGYEIYHSVDGGAVTTVPVAGGATKNTTVNLTLSPRAKPYTIQFSISALDTDGLKSKASNAVIASVVVQNALPAPPGNQKIDLKCDRGICSLTVQAAN